MRALLGLPVLALIFGVATGSGVTWTPELLPVAAVVCLAYGALALIEVVPEAAYERIMRARAAEERRWAEARSANHNARPLTR